jgi:RNA-directed DNA polymerase
LKGYGILTNYHVTSELGMYKVYTPDKYDFESICYIGKDINEEKFNENIDYALYKLSMENVDSGFEIGDSEKLEIEDSVTIIGYPDYHQNDTPSIPSCQITSIKNYYHGSRLITVSGRIIHGASGGPVLNDNGEVIGLIKGGVVTTDEEFNSNNQGFIPINDILEDINK